MNKCKSDFLSRFYKICTNLNFYLRRANPNKLTIPTPNNQTAAGTGTAFTAPSKWYSNANPPIFVGEPPSILTW